MELREKVTKGLECCREMDNPPGWRVGGCEDCPYESCEDRCAKMLKEDVIIVLKALSAFKMYFDELYGAGLGVANWHMNGDIEPFDSFYDSAMEEYENAQCE